MLERLFWLLLAVLVGTASSSASRIEVDGTSIARPDDSFAADERDDEERRKDDGEREDEDATRDDEGGEDDEEDDEEDDDGPERRLEELLEESQHVKRELQQLKAETQRVQSNAAHLNEMIGLQRKIVEVWSAYQRAVDADDEAKAENLEAEYDRMVARRERMAHKVHLANMKRELKEMLNGARREGRKSLQKELLGQIRQHAELVATIERLHAARKEGDGEQANVLEHRAELLHGMLEMRFRRVELQARRRESQEHRNSKREQYLTKAIEISKSAIEVFTQLQAAHKDGDEEKVEALEEMLEPLHEKIHRHREIVEALDRLRDAQREGNKAEVRELREVLRHLDVDAE